MKKLVSLLALTIAMLVGIATVSAQRNDGYYGNQNRVEQRQDRNWNGNRHREVLTRNEYRYVQYGRRVYRETYQTTYVLRGRREVIINRVLISRAEVRDYDRRRYKPRFNIFLRF
jgi:hypothetical protein